MALSVFHERFLDKGFKVPFVPVEVKPVDYEQGASKVVAEIEGNRLEKRLKFNVFSGGYTNTVINVMSKKDKYVFRIYGEKTDLFINREDELLNSLYLGSWGLGPKILAVYQNGFCAELVAGKTLDPRDTGNWQVSEIIIRGVAKLHYESQRLEKKDSEEALLKKTFLGSWLDLIPNSLNTPEDNQRLEDIIMEFGPFPDVCSNMLNLIDKLQSPVQFCHNDLCCGNVIYDSKEDKIRFVDMEYSGYNYRGFEIAHHFCEFAGVDKPDYDLFPKKEFQLRWIKRYLEEMAVLNGKDSSSVTEQEVSDLYFEVQHFVPACHLMWGIWSLFQAKHSIIDYDYVKYARIRLTEYLKRLHMLKSGEV